MVPADGPLPSTKYTDSCSRRARDEVGEPTIRAAYMTSTNGFGHGATGILWRAMHAITQLAEYLIRYLPCSYTSQVTSPLLSLTGTAVPSRPQPGLSAA